MKRCVFSAMTVFIAICIITGCTSKPAAEPPATGEELVSKVREAITDIFSYSYSVEATATRTIERTDELGVASSYMASSTQVDLRNSQGHMETNTAEIFEIDGEIEEDIRKVSAIYIVDNAVYTGEADVGREIDFLTGPGAEGALQSLDYVGNHLGLLDDSEVILSLVNEEVRGIDCFIVDLELEATALFNYMIIWSGLEVMMFEGAEPEEIMSEMMSYVDEYTFRIWYATDTCNLMKVYQYLKMSFQFEEESWEFIYEWNREFDDYNQPLSIQVPASATEALFTDIFLLEDIRGALGKPEGVITREDLKSLTALSLSSGVDDLSGLEHCSNLQTLDIFILNSDEISVVSSLTNLITLSIFSYTGDDISPLSALTNLTSLELGGDDFVDVYPLCSLSKLKELRIDVNPGTDISCLTCLPELVFLELWSPWDDDITDISSVRDFNTLPYLALGAPHLTDISPLSSLTNLQGLYIYSNDIYDISPIESLVQLERLTLKAHILQDISALESLANLEELTLEIRYSADFTPIATLSNLRMLDLSDIDIVDISVLSSLHNLTSLIANGNKIVDISPLSNLTNLTELNLHYNQIVDISPLSTLTSLTALDLGSNDIMDISPLANLTNLKVLNLTRNNPDISDISPLAGLTNLRELILVSNDIIDISPLAGLSSLSVLNLTHNEIVDISPLVALTNLSDISLDGNPIRDISPLVQNTGLGAGDEVTIDEDYVDDRIMEDVEVLEARGVVVNIW